MFTLLPLYMYRHYAPELGRFVSRDPINERGGVNLYGFVENNPVSAFDIHGLAVCTVACYLCNAGDSDGKTRDEEFDPTTHCCEDCVYLKKVIPKQPRWHLMGYNSSKECQEDLSSYNKDTMHGRGYTFLAQSFTSMAAGTVASGLKKVGQAAGAAGGFAAEGASATINGSSVSTNYMDDFVARICDGKTCPSSLKKIADPSNGASPMNGIFGLPNMVHPSLR